MVFSAKEEITLVFFVFFDQMCTTLLICISNHAFLVCFKYKCHVINFLLTSFARYVQRNIGPRSFCTNLALRSTGLVCTKKTSVRYFSVPHSVNKKLIIDNSHCRLIFYLGKKVYSRKERTKISILFYCVRKLLVFSAQMW